MSSNLIYLGIGGLIGAGVVGVALLAAAHDFHMARMVLDEEAKRLRARNAYLQNRKQTTCINLGK